jgi:hypothetical protein
MSSSKKQNKTLISTLFVTSYYFVVFGETDVNVPTPVSKKQKNLRIKTS